MADDELRKIEGGLGLREDASIVTAPDVGRVVETAPVKEPETFGEWIKLNLFSGVLNSILSIISMALVVWAGVKLFNFVFVNSEWQVIRANMKGYMVGGVPLEEVWRVWGSLYLVAILAGFSQGALGRPPRMTRRRAVIAAVVALIATSIVWFTTTTTLARALSFLVPVAVAGSYFVGRGVGPRARTAVRVAWLLWFPVTLILIRGFDGVPPRLWGGFFFNLLAAVVAIVASFPIGIALALGRRSSFPAIRMFCVGVIEIFRGAPLVGWLIFAKYGLEFLFPPQMEVPDIIKALTMMTMFSAAYIAEIVRGGLQGVPAGQYEAARAIGLSTSRMMALIVMPQALRATIPALISHFISLFKDTALFAAIEVTDLLAASSRLGLEFIGQEAQTLTFAALLFWMVAFSMSRWSQRLEVRLGVGER